MAARENWCRVGEGGGRGWKPGRMQWKWGGMGTDTSRKRGMKGVKTRRKGGGNQEKGVETRRKGGGNQENGGGEMETPEETGETSEIRGSKTRR